ncbi:MAG: Gfo/Idh/MocA family oxidoreductase, partial [Bacteroidota bacterium]
YSAGILGLSLKSNYKLSEVEEAYHQALLPQSNKFPSVMSMAAKAIDNVHVGIIGLGNRGAEHLRQLLSLKDKATVAALCDIQNEKIEGAKAQLKKAGATSKIYTEQEDWKKLVQQDNIDLVIIATPWKDHVAMAVEAMRNKKHVAIEVPAAFTIQECWDLVNTSEEMQVHCMMMENVCYGAEELWILNMVEDGVFGTLTHAEAAYIHDLRALMFSKTYYYDQWRLKHHIKKDGNLYPTHGLGPVAQYMGIARGDRFEKIVSMSSLQAGLTEHTADLTSDNPFYGQVSYVHGDMNSSLIKTSKGRSILVQHDVVTPRPYSRINALGGTKAYHEGYPSRLSLNSYKDGHRWLDEESYQEMRQKYKHPIWNQLKEAIERNGGHGGMDFVQMYRLIDCLNNGEPLDMDVYDAVDWSVVVPLSKLSVELGSMAMEFPDFTRGKWKEERSLGIMSVSR